MAKKKSASSKKDSCCDWSCTCSSKSGGGCMYMLGYIGAAVYYVQMATGFWAGVWGLIKALVWPALLVHHLLGM